MKGERLPFPYWSENLLTPLLTGNTNKSKLAAIKICNSLLPSGSSWAVRHFVQDSCYPGSQIFKSLFKF